MQNKLWLLDKKFWVLDLLSKLLLKLLKLLIWDVCVCISCLVVSDSVRPHRLQPTRSLRPRDSPGKTTGVGCHFLLQKELQKESEVARCVWLFATPWTVAYQGPPSTEFSRQEYWSGLPFPSPPLHYRGLKYKSRKSRNTWSNRQVWPWGTKWSRAKANKVLSRERTGHSK